MLRTTLGALLIALLAGPALADVSMFRMPSGNVECAVGTGEAPSDITCVIFQRNGAAAAPSPAGCADPWGHWFQMREQGRAQMGCGGPGTPRLGPEHDVAYGASGDSSGISCLSSRDGLECRNADGHGFFLSRARQEIF
jgi:hypothetical protein